MSGGTRTAHVTANGRMFKRTLEPRVLLVDFLRHDYGLTGSDVSGACMILLNAVSFRSCLTFAVQAGGGTVTTVRGLGDGEIIDALRHAFQDHHALQSSFCTPDFLMFLTEFLREAPELKETAIRLRMAGNLCHCTGYTNIVRAVQGAVKTIRREAIT